MCQFPRKVSVPVPQAHLGGIPRHITIDVPCGRCVQCRKVKQEQWVFRFEQERKCWSQCSFITLTYANDHLPVYDSTLDRIVIGRQHRGLSTLYYRDVQLFNKKLRHKIGRFRFYVVGEYGPNGTCRPHYHLLVFHNHCNSDQLYNVVRQIWGKGTITCNDANISRFYYVSKYACSVGIDRLSRHRPPFARCSNRSAIGSCWLNSDLASYCKSFGKRTILRSFVNKKGERITYIIPIPRYYLQKMDMSLSYEDLHKINDQKFHASLNSVPKHMTCFEVDNGFKKRLVYVAVEYFEKCKQAYKCLVDQHKYRDYESHIKFDFQTWLKSFHQFLFPVHRELHSLLDTHTYSQPILEGSPLPVGLIQSPETPPF